MVFSFFVMFSFCQSIFLHSESYIYSRCSSQKFAVDSPYTSSINEFLQSAVSSASKTHYGSFDIGNQSTIENEYTTLFGLYQCRGDLKPGECLKCVQSAANQIAIVCDSSYGASIQLEGCSIRYDRENLLSVQDYSVIFKKCSKSRASNAIEFIRHRDEVLSDLQSTSAFNVCSSDLVEGFAQCLGDIGTEYCSACLAQAFASLKALCGPSASASVYLGQCYAKYWASGYYDDSSVDRPDKADGAGKSIAMVIGVVAGVALVVVVLSICRTGFA